MKNFFNSEHTSRNGSPTCANAEQRMLSKEISGINKSSGSSQKMYHGKSIMLRPAEQRDSREIYEWLALSDLTASMMGPPLFPEAPIPTWEQFCLEYPSHFFDGSRSMVGRSYIIELNGQSIGHINYDGLNPIRRCAELDIWMRSSSFCGQGYGSDAIETLVKYLQDQFHVNEFILRPSQRNKRAIRSYERAGFIKMVMPRDEQARLYGPGDYFDAVLMIRKELI